MEAINKFKKAYLAISAVFVIAGLFLVLDPQISQQAIGILIGLIFMSFGALRLLGFILNVGLKSESIFDFINALLNIGLGMFVIYNHGAVLSAASMVVGIIAAFESVMKIITSFELKNAGYENWKHELAVSIIAAVLALFIIFNPFKTAMTLYVMFGIAMTAYGLFRFWCAFKLSEIFKVLAPIETTASVTDDVPAIDESGSSDDKKDDKEEKEETSDKTEDSEKASDEKQ